VHIRAVYAANRGAYGWPRIWRELHAQGIRVGKQRVQRLMRQHGIRARGKRRFRVTTTDSRHSLPIAPNLLNRNFTVTTPNQASNLSCQRRTSGSGEMSRSKKMNFPPGFKTRRAASNECRSSGPNALQQGLYH
jgi:transposase InsO family protein